MMTYSFMDERGLPVWYDDEKYEAVNGVLVRKKGSAAVVETKVLGDKESAAPRTKKFLIRKKG